MMNPTPASAPPCLLSIRRLTARLRPDRHSRWSSHDLIQAVELFDLDVHDGESVVVTGESGTGKSVLVRTLAGLQPATSGSLRLSGRELLREEIDIERDWHAHIQLVAQVPFSGLGPRSTAKGILERHIRRVLPELAAEERRIRITEALQQVGWAPTAMKQRLRDLSPLDTFRLALARALASRPRLLVCDAPGAAFEVAEQKQVLDLLMRVRHERRLTLLLTALDARPWRGAVDRVVVLYLGRIVEQGDPRSVFDTPAHPYTRALLASKPFIRVDKHGTRRAELHVPGDPPDPAHPPIGCVFHPRCPIVDPACLRDIPPLRRTGSATHHYAACLFALPATDAAEGVPTRNVADKASGGVRPPVRRSTRSRREQPPV